jgi:HD-GYP domain-containing protein (c-di-GMP phosphodiesterase class II)
MCANALVNVRQATRQTPENRESSGRSSGRADSLAKLRQWFGVEFNLFDGNTGEMLHLATDGTQRDWNACGQFCRVVAERNHAEFIEDEEPLLVLAIPLHGARNSLVAVGTFVTEASISARQLSAVAKRLGLARQDAEKWLAEQTRWMPNVLLSMAQLITDNLASEQRMATLEEEIRNVSLQLSITYEEISLLHRLTQNLKLSSNDEELGQLALEWLADVLPAESLALLLTPTSRSGAINRDARAEPVLLTYGPCPVGCDDVNRMIEHLRLAPGGRPQIVNRSATLDDSWQWPAVRELIIVSLCEGDNCFGWVVACNHAQGGQFGTVEASLLGSVGVILGIHSGNAELYRQHREFFAGVVRALTSAIDAKDPYTCGHSDRVARVSVRLAEELGLDRKQVDSIYLSGLLHDVGKIGIDDNVLRKPGRLTEAEFEHIKTHSEIGYKILVDIPQLDEVLPVVLHHHEQWDGKGYPRGLAGEAIPLLARIVAVADSFDAMSSDRPYRQGMGDEKLDAILRDGAGKQWDAAVVEAFFGARDEIRNIAHKPVKNLTLDLHD